MIQGVARLTRIILQGLLNNDGNPGLTDSFDLSHLIGESVTFGANTRQSGVTISESPVSTLPSVQSKGDPSSHSSTRIKVTQKRAKRKLHFITC